MVGERMRNVIVWGVLGIIAVLVLYAIAKAIPYAWAGVGGTVFAVGGSAVWFLMKGRKRIVLIVVIALVSIAIVIALRVTTRQTLTILNESDLAIRDLIVLLPASSRVLKAQNIPPHSEITLSFHSTAYSPDVVVVGHFADGTEIPSKIQARLPVIATMPVSVRRQTKVVIESGGAVRVWGE